jgi:mono/diheme cytochrome c family protein
MKKTWFLLFGLALLLGVMAGCEDDSAGSIPPEILAAAQAKAADATWEADIQPLFAQYCFACHTGPAAQKKVNLASYATAADLKKDTGIVEEMIDEIEEKEMPPAGSPMPTDEQRALLVQWLRLP